jgi:putative membrane protein
MLPETSKHVQVSIKPAHTQAAQFYDEPNGLGFFRSSAFTVAGLALAVILLASAGVRSAEAQPATQTAENAASTKLTPVDYNFVAQANLGAPFQIDSGRVAERKGTSSDVREYAHLMVVTHIPVVEALNKIIEQKDIKAPQNTLLHGAYDAMVFTLKADRGAGLDRDYIDGQVEYQKGNAALFRDEIENGTDPQLKAFARATLPKIEDHLNRALKLAKDAKLRIADSESRN